MVAPPGVLAPYQRDGQARQAKTPEERLRDGFALAAQQDRLLGGLTALNDSGQLAAGSQRDRYLRDQVREAGSAAQLKAIAESLLHMGMSPGGPPVIPGRVIRDGHEDRHQRGDGSGERERQLAELQAEARAFAGSALPRRRYFTSAPALPAGPHQAPAAGELIPATAGAYASPPQRACTRCRRAPAAVSAERGEITPAVLAAMGPGGTMPAELCHSCVQLIQAAHPGTWSITPLAPARRTA
ncbi:MAG: hypothetical protein ACHP9Z_12285 [Streptosporangiales bacterium]